MPPFPPFACLIEYTENVVDTICPIALPVKKKELPQTPENTGLAILTGYVHKACKRVVYTM